MTTTRIHLTETESERLQAMARRTGRTPEQLPREAVESFLMPSDPQDRLTLLRQARGIWKDRRDLPDLEALRAD